MIQNHPALLAPNSAGGFYPYTVDSSARFDGASNLYLTPGTGDSVIKWTFACNFKVCAVGQYQGIAQWATTPGSGSPFGTLIRINNTGVLEISRYTGTSYQWKLLTSRLFRDTASFYSLVIVYDSAQATTSDRIKVYINGVQETSFSTTNYPTLNEVSDAGSNRTIWVGSLAIKLNPTNYFTGYLTEVVALDGYALAPSDFGEFKNGIWVPKNVSGLTFGTNGFYLDFADSAALGTDVSGNGNNFTSSGLTSSDQMADTPTNNFATLNPLINPTGLDSTFYEGNLAMQTNTAANSNGTNTTQSSIAIPSSGKWFFEFRPRSYGGQFNVFNAIGGIAPSYETINDAGWKNGIEYYANGNKYINNVSTSYGASWVVGDVIGVLVDADNVSVTFYKNGTSQGEITSATHGFSNFNGWHFTLEDGASTEYVYYDANFGQNGTFNNAITAGGNTDANGIGNFKYTVPTDALALCTANLPEPTIGPNSDIKPSDCFATVLYTGNGTEIGSGGLAVTGVGFQPDMVWIKSRSHSSDWMMFDSVRGVTKSLSSGWTYNNEVTDTESLSTFDADGFTLGSNYWVNLYGGDYIAYCFKITAGFLDIQTFTGTGDAKTETHDLGVVPNFLSMQATTHDAFFPPLHYCSSLPVSAPETQYLSLGDPRPAITAYWAWNNTAPTSSVFTVGDIAEDEDGMSYIVYLFADVEGFCKTGYYKGNGVDGDGPFQHLGFSPQVNIVKLSNGYSPWQIFDTLRMPYNWTCNMLYFNDYEAEITAGDENIYGVDILSNGNKVRASGQIGPDDANFNVDGGDYITLSIGTSSKYSNAR